MLWVVAGMSMPRKGIPTVLSAEAKIISSAALNPAVEELAAGGASATPLSVMNLVHYHWCRSLHHY